MGSANTFAHVEAVDNGNIVRFSRHKKIQRQVRGPSPEMIARLGGEVLKAIHGGGESWKGGDAEGEAPEPKLENVYVVEQAAIFCADDAALAKAIGDAKKAHESLEAVGLDQPFANAVPAGVGLSRGFVHPFQQ